MAAAKANAAGARKLMGTSMASPPYFRLAQLLQQQLLQRRVGTGREKIDSATRAKLAQTLAIIPHGLLISLQTIAAKSDLLHRPRLGIHQTQVPEGGGIQFVGREDLHGVHLKAAPDQGGEARLVTDRIEKIAEHHGQAGPAGFQRPAAERVIEIGRTAGGELAEVLEKLHRRFSSPHRPKRAASGRFGRRHFRGGGAAVGCRARHPAFRVWERDDAHAVEAAQRDIADVRVDLPREIKFARYTEAHRLTGVEENADWQLALLFVEFEEQPFQPPVEIPVQIAEIVAVGVVAVIGELDRLSARAAAALAA